MKMTKNDVFPSLKERRNEITTLYSLPPRSDNIWILKPRNQIDKISIVSDNMFHTIFNHPKGKKYIAYLISLFLKIDNDTLLKHCEINETIITVKMNNNSSIEVLHRNNRQFSVMVKKSKNYDKYRQSILINFNNFSFLGKDETYYINYIKDEEGIVLTDDIMIINIYIPNLLKNAIIQVLKAQMKQKNISMP